jgi:general secretion pathway protein F
MIARSQALSADEAAEFSARVAELSAAGLPLSGGLRAAAREIASRRVAGVLNDLAGRLEAGEPLPSAIDEMGSSLPAHLRALMLIGLRSGQFDQTLEQFVWQQQQARAAGRQAWIALAYPLLLLLATVVLIPIFSVYVVGEVVAIAEDFEAELPAQSRVLASVAGLGWLAPVGTLTLLGITALGIWSLGIVPRTQPIAERMPVLGTLWRWTSLAQFCRLLALLVERGVPLPEALELLGSGLRDRTLAAGCRAAATEVAAGHSLAVVLGRTPFPPTLVSLVAWGQQGSTLAASLQAAAALYEDRAKGQLALIRTLVPPVVFLLVLGAMVFLLTAALLPMLNVITMLT